MSGDKTTIWTYDEYDEAWECQNCKIYWQLNDGTPQENGVKFCPGCGQEISEFITAEEEQEEEGS